MLKKLEFDHRSMEEEALVERFYTDASGQERLAKIVDRSKLYNMFRERRAKGRETMAPFVSWCVTYKGLSDANADRKGAMVFTAMWETHNRPWEKILRDDINEFQKSDLQSALKLFGEWLVLKGPTAEDKEWGHRLLSNLGRIRTTTVKRKAKPVAEGANAKKRLLRPFSEEEWEGIFEAIEDWHKVRGASRPWARNFFRFKFKIGIGHTVTPLYYLARTDILRALDELEDGKVNAVVKLWTSHTKVRLIPVRLVEKELRALVEFPAPWGILADLIIPKGVDEGMRARNSQFAVQRAWKDIMARSEGRVSNEVDWFRRARLTAIEKAWSQSRDRLLIQAMFGLSWQSLKSMHWLEGIDYVI